jgi:N-acetylglutamate synthase-like GNAT family acetyltransferase
MKNIVFRGAKISDLTEIVRLLGDDDLGSQREKISGEIEPSYTSAFEAISTDPHNNVYVVEREGKVMGCLQLTKIPNLSFSGAWRGQIEGVRIDKSLRGSGIGTEFFKWTLERARQSGCKIVQLTMNTARTDTHRFYENLGFIASHTGFKLYF